MWSTVVFLIDTELVFKLSGVFPSRFTWNSWLPEKRKVYMPSFKLVGPHVSPRVKGKHITTQPLRRR